MKDSIFVRLTEFTITTIYNKALRAFNTEVKKNFPPISTNNKQTRFHIQNSDISHHQDRDADAEAYDNL